MPESTKFDGSVIQHQPPPESDLASARIVILSGRDEILSQAALLEDLAGSSGQAGAMHGLAYQVDQKYASRKIPYLVSFFSETNCLLASVLLFEYCVGSRRTGFFTTNDNFGIRTVIGPEPLRPFAAAAVCSALLQRQARMVLVSFRHGPLAGLPDTPPSTCLRAMQVRPVQDYLPLAGTYEQTLSLMGKRTRNHLRYYRRGLEKNVPCDFILDVSPFIDPDDSALIEQLNCSSLEPLPTDIFNLQYRSTALLRGGYVSGLRSRQGNWLSLVGGWRQNDTTWVQWQMNSAGYETLSLATAFRAILIEQEIARGTRRLVFQSGTSHSMRHAFPVEHVVDLIARRPGLLTTLITRIVPLLRQRMPSLATRGNFLIDALSSSDLRWSSKR
jgi:hypothetical protein